MTVEWTTCKKCQRAVKYAIYAYDLRECGHCGTTINPPSGGIRVALEYVELGQQALWLGRAEEAEGYFIAALTIDASLTDAWIGKGEAASRLSNINNMRTEDILVAYKHAAATAPDGDRTVITRFLVENVGDLVTRLAQSSRQNLIAHISLSTSWSRYVVELGKLLDVLQEVRGWIPSHRKTLETIIAICSSILDGIQQNDSTSGEAYAWAVSKEYAEIIGAVMDSATDALKTLHSTKPKLALN